MILSVNKLSKSYGTQKVLQDISFSIEKPQIIALVGPNGSGKSTLLNIIANLLPAVQGSISLMGKSNQDPAIFRDVSYMQDNSVLYDYLTGYDHLQFIGDVQKVSKKQVLAAAERIGITSFLNKKVSNYSLGMKQQLLLTMAIVNEPKLLIMDEPLNGLDPTNAIKVRNLLLELAKEGTAILLSSHNLSEIDRVTSNILFLKNGELLKENLADYENVYYHFTLNTLEDPVNLLKDTKVIVKSNQGNRLVLSLNGTLLTEILGIFNREGIVIADVEKKVVGSEERYQELFGKPEAEL
ncbi:ABC transporter ATP-binding protein [Planomicrobium sp. MB-3u-38]|uniref:ABC transporter ATP-binding protein n=1 Tax=Planomicrobium sp. MB-3u-38 TaxID=2058318 RepID=UPI000C7E5D46|nr:ABC transporter ATP-binding protein [Planomicrobium sp. MB-3u-38]PKH11694.1 ABC transporter ATP-binding protein [Planomicrobium sp. MB-3u-38]